MNQLYLELKLVEANATVRKLLAQISKIEADTQSDANKRLLQLRKVREELNKVATEIDIIKKEFNLLTHYRVN